MNAADVLAEALARIEYKIDTLAKKLKIDLSQFEDKMIPGIRRICPFCSMPVEDLVDLDRKVVKRTCGCSTGKFIVTFDGMSEDFKKQVEKVVKNLSNGEGNDGID